MLIIEIKLIPNAVFKALENLKEGDIVENAVVKATTDWGIFLDINGIDALLHVSDLSHGRVKKPSDLVTIGQKLKVKITKIDEKIISNGTVGPITKQIQTNRRLRSFSTIKHFNKSKYKL